METVELIEAYLDGTLNDAERKRVEERIADDVDFKQLVELHQEVNESISDTRFHLFHSLIQRADAAYFDTNHKLLPVENASSPVVRLKGIMRYAAMALVVLGVAAVLKFTFFNGAQPDKLFEHYYVAYQADIVTRSSQSAGTTLEKAVKAYNREDYDMALQELNGLISVKPGDYLAWFYKGLTCLALDQTSEAIHSFRMIDPDWDHPLLEHRNWYLALALLHNNNREEAIVFFTEIRELNGYYAENAGKILRKLGS